MTIEASLTCDGCAHIILAASNSILARRELREMGGRATRDGDFCAQCVGKGYADSRERHPPWVVRAERRSAATGAGEPHGHEG